VAGLASSTMLWQRLDTMQEALARQSQEANTQAIEARTRPARPRTRDCASARLAAGGARQRSNLRTGSWKS
jgi:uroporphyrin-3 C-methyltransferase